MVNNPQINYLRLYSMSISKMDGLLTRSWHQDVTLLEHEIREGFERFCAREAADCSVGNFPVLQLPGMNAIRVVDGTVKFLYSNAENNDR